MKTAEEILDKYLANYPWQHWSKENAIKAMEEYRQQSPATPVMSAQYSSGAIHSLGEFPATAPMSAEQVEELAEKHADLKYDKAMRLISWSNTKHDFIAGYNAAVPSVKADGWVIPDNVTLKDIKAVRDYFGEHDKTPFEHRAYIVMDKLVDFFMPLPAPPQQ